MNKTFARVGIIGAMELEIEALRALLAEPETEVISGVRFTKGKLCGAEAVIAVCGMGKCAATLCAEAMILRYAPDLVVNVGVAGTLTHKLGIGDLAIGKNAVCHDIDATPIGDPLGQIANGGLVHIPLSAEAAAQFEAVCRKEGINTLTGTIASGDQFIVDPSKKAWIVDAFGAVACEMEGAAIAFACHVNRVPCAILRSISDSIEGGAADYETFKYRAAKTTEKVVKGFLEAK